MAFSAVNEAFSLIDILDMQNDESAATVYLNGATTLKAFGMAFESLEYYSRAKQIYDVKLSSSDFRLAAYYNNVSSAYKDTGDFDNAEKSCFLALEVLCKNDGYNGEKAVTHINLAHLYYDKDVFDERIYEHVETAWELLNAPENRHDGEFAFLCSKCYPSFGYFGYFDYEEKIKELCRRIYEGT